MGKTVCQKYSAYYKSHSKPSINQHYSIINIDCLDAYCRFPPKKTKEASSMTSIQKTYYPIYFLFSHLSQWANNDGKRWCYGEIFVRAKKD